MGLEIKIPKFKFPKFKFKEIDDVEDINLEKEKEKTEKNKKDKKQYEGTHYKTIKDAKFTYSSKNKEIATIDETTGKITSIKKGKTQISVIDTISGQTTVADVLGFENKEDENTSNVYLLKDGTLFCFMEEKILKSAQAKNTSIHKRPLTLCAGC